jgi:hypothetical protein
VGQQGKDYGKDTVEHAESVARLQGQLATVQEKFKKADEEAARLRAAIGHLQGDLYSQTAQLATKVTPHLPSAFASGLSPECFSVAWVVDTCGY